jgi:hypothetical protein
MSKSFIKYNTSGTFVSFLVSALQPIISTMIPIVKKENDSKMVYLAKATVSAPPVRPKMEYFIYVKRFGPPQKGIFDEQALNTIREEYGIPMTVAQKTTYAKPDGKFVPVPDTGDNT